MRPSRGWTAPGTMRYCKWRRAGRVVESGDTRDLKSLGGARPGAGSSPAAANHALSLQHPASSPLARAEAHVIRPIGAASLPQALAARNSAFPAAWARPHALAPRRPPPPRPISSGPYTPNKGIARPHRGRTHGAAALPAAGRRPDRRGGFVPLPAGLLHGSRACARRRRPTSLSRATSSCAAAARCGPSSATGRRGPGCRSTPASSSPGPTAAWPCSKRGRTTASTAASTTCCPQLQNYAGRERVWIRRRCVPLTAEQSAALTAFAQTVEHKLRFALVRHVPASDAAAQPRPPPDRIPRRPARRARQLLLLGTGDGGVRRGRVARLRHDPAGGDVPAPTCSSAARTTPTSTGTSTCPNGTRRCAGRFGRGPRRPSAPSPTWTATRRRGFGERGASAP